MNAAAGEHPRPLRALARDARLIQPAVALLVAATVLVMLVSLAAVGLNR